MSEQNSQIPKPELITSGSPDEQLALKSIERDINDHPYRYLIALGQLAPEGSEAQSTRPIGPVDEETTRRLDEYFAEPAEGKSLSKLVEFDDHTADLIYANPRLKELIAQVKNAKGRTYTKGRGPSEHLDNPEATRMSRLVGYETFALFIDQVISYQRADQEPKADGRLPKAM